jgi:hypothetical protein
MRFEIKPPSQSRFPDTHLSVRFTLWRRLVEVRGIPHLAKNERDMGHPDLVSRYRIAAEFLFPNCDL